MEKKRSQSIFLKQMKAGLDRLPNELIDGILQFLPHRTLWNTVRPASPQLRQLAEHRFFQKLRGLNDKAGEDDIRNEDFLLRIHLMHRDDTRCLLISNHQQQTMRLTFSGLDLDGRLLQYCPIFIANARTDYQLTMNCDWQHLSEGRLVLGAHFIDEQMQKEKHIIIPVTPPPVLWADSLTPATWYVSDNQGLVRLAVTYRPHHYAAELPNQVRLSVSFAKMDPDLRYG